MFIEKGQDSIKSNKYTRKKALSEALNRFHPYILYFTNNQAVINAFIYSLAGILFFYHHKCLWRYYIIVLLFEIILIFMMQSGFIPLIVPATIMIDTAFFGVCGILYSFMYAFLQIIQFADYLTGISIAPKSIRQTFNTVLELNGYSQFVNKGLKMAKMKKKIDNQDDGFVKKISSKLSFLLDNYMWAEYFPGTPSESLIALFGSILDIFITFSANVFPIGGRLILNILHSRRNARLLHMQYFYLKGYNSNEINQFLLKRNIEYRWFGFISGIMSSIPILGIFFYFTNTIAVALWVISTEQHESLPFFFDLDHAEKISPLMKRKVSFKVKSRRSFASTSYRF